MLGDDPRYGWRADVVESCHIGTGLTACNDAFGNLAPFGGVEFLATAAYASLGPSGGKTGGGALTNHRSFELREGTDHLHHHAPGRGCGVDVLGDRTKASTNLGDPLHDVQHVFQRAGQTVELPDDHGIAIPQMAKHAV